MKVKKQQGMWTETDHTHCLRADTSAVQWLRAQADVGGKAKGEERLADSKAGTPAGPSGELGLDDGSDPSDSPPLLSS